MQSEEEWNIGCYFRDVADEVAYYTFTSGRYPKINYIPGNVDKDTRPTTNSNGVLNVYVPQEYSIQQFQQELHTKMSQQYSTLLYGQQQAQLQVKVIPCTFNTVEQAQAEIKAQNNANTNTYFRLISDSNNRLYIMVCNAPSLDVKQKIQEQFEPSNGSYYTPTSMDINPNTFDSSSSLGKEEKYLAALKVFATTGIMPLETLPKPDEDDEEQGKLYNACRSAYITYHDIDAKNKVLRALLQIIDYSSANGIDTDEKLKEFAMQLNLQTGEETLGLLHLTGYIPDPAQVLGLEPNNPLIPVNPGLKKDLPLYFNPPKNILPVQYYNMTNAQIIDNMVNLAPNQQPYPDINLDFLNLYKINHGFYQGSFPVGNNQSATVQFNKLHFHVIRREDGNYNVTLTPYDQFGKKAGPSVFLQNIKNNDINNQPGNGQIAIKINGKPIFIDMQDNDPTCFLDQTNLDILIPPAPINQNNNMIMNNNMQGNQNQQQGQPFIDWNILNLKNEGGYYKATFWNNVKQQYEQVAFNALYCNIKQTGPNVYDVVLRPAQDNNIFPNFLICCQNVQGYNIPGNNSQKAFKIKINGGQDRNIPLCNDSNRFYPLVSTFVNSLLPVPNQNINNQQIFNQQMNNNQMLFNQNMNNMGNQNQQQGQIFTKLNDLQLQNEGSGWYSYGYFDGSKPQRRNFSQLVCKVEMQSNNLCKVSFTTYDNGHWFRAVSQENIQGYPVPGKPGLIKFFVNVNGQQTPVITGVGSPTGYFITPETLNALIPPAPNQNIVNQPNQNINNQQMLINQPINMQGNQNQQQGYIDIDWGNIQPYNAGDGCYGCWFTIDGVPTEYVFNELCFEIKKRQEDNNYDVTFIPYRNKQPLEPFTASNIQGCWTNNDGSQTWIAIKANGRIVYLNTSCAGAGRYAMEPNHLNYLMQPAPNQNISNQPNNFNNNMQGMNNNMNNQMNNMNNNMQGNMGMINQQMNNNMNNQNKMPIFNKNTNMFEFNFVYPTEYKGNIQQPIELPPLPILHLRVMNDFKGIPFLVVQNDTYDKPPIYSYQINPPMTIKVKFPGYINCQNVNIPSSPHELLDFKPPIQQVNNQFYSSPQMNVNNNNNNLINQNFANNNMGLNQQGGK